MKPILVGMFVAIALSACATTPKGPADMILGKWNCGAESDGIKVAGLIEYLPGGLNKGTPAIDINAGGMAIKMTGTMEGTWAFQTDGTLKEGITALKVETASMSGNTAAPPMIASMVQPMVNQMIVGQSTTSTVVFSGTSFVATDEDGTVTTCKR